MIEECIHLMANGRKCRRIPKRGQKFCPAHQPHRRRRGFLEEDEAANRQISEMIGRLHAMPLDDMLYTTGNLLNEIYPVMDRRCARRDRLAFVHALSAVQVSAERIAEALPGFHRYVAAQPAPAPAAPRQPPSPATQAALAQAEALLQSGRPLSPNEFAGLYDDLINTLDPNAKTSPALHANR